MKPKLIGFVSILAILIYLYPNLFLSLFIFLSLSIISFVLFLKFYYGLTRKHLDLFLYILKFDKLIPQMEKENQTVDKLWDDTIKKVKDDKPFIINANNGEILTFGQADRRSNQIASFVLKHSKLNANETIAIYMHNNPNYAVTWLGLAKIGVRSSFINFYLKEDALIHSLLISDCKAIIFDIDFLENVKNVKQNLEENGVKYFYYTGSKNDVQEISDWAVNIDDQSDKEPVKGLDQSLRASSRGCLFADPIIYIFTSGTTGLPKAAKISHYRYFAIPFNFFNVSVMNTNDVVYCPLPLYHTAGGVVGLGMSVIRGTTLVLREKFSKTNFLSDIQKYECTVCQYIGEMARYVSLEKEEGSQNNNLRIAIGNGLRREVWEKFQKKFGIHLICEFYGSSEGSGGLVNVFHEVGAVGWTPPLLPGTSFLVKYDENTNELLRGKDGKCIKCKPGEEGHLLQVIKNISKTTNFNGYTNKNDTQKKVENDVFVAGDKYYKTGDILKRDYRGYWYFVDRVGDTFRWKGENVSTMEVASELFKFGSIKEINVYGVSLPNTDGRCGMMAINGIDKSSFPFDKFYSFAKEKLPVYSIPIFIRVVGDMDVTSTFKHKKVEYRNEGFDINTFSDPVYFRKGDTYVPLDLNSFEEIMNNKIKF